MRRKLKTSKKMVLLKWGGGLVVVLLVGAVIAANAVLRTVTDETFLAKKIEKRINSEVTIGDVELSLLTVPAQLTMRDVVLKGKAGDPLGRGAMVSVKNVKLQVSLWSLLRKKIDVVSMSVKEAHVKGMIYKKEGSSLKALFESPEKARKRLREKALVAPVVKKKKKDLVKKAQKSESKKEEEGGFNAFDQSDFVASLGGFYIIDSSVELMIEKSGVNVVFQDINLSLASINIDPKRLQDTDKVALKLAFKTRINSVQNTQYANLELEGEVRGRVFDEVTGDFSPDIVGKLNFSKNSWLNTRIPVVSKVWGKLNELKKIGVLIDPLPERAEFGRSESLAAHFSKGKITVLEPLSLWLGDWEMAVLAQSWEVTKTNQHEIHAEIVASKKFSTGAYQLIVQIFKLLPSKMREEMTADMSKKLFRDDRLLVKMKSSGDLSHPKVRLVDGIPDLGKNIKKEGEKALKKKAQKILEGILR